MEIYFKQSLKCVYANLRDQKYKAYTYYDKGETLVADHPQCTHAQINQGYTIEFVVIAIVTAIACGIINRYADRCNKIDNFFGGGATSAIASLAIMLVLNFITMVLPIFTTLVIGIVTLGSIYWCSNKMSNPVDLWREHQRNKERRVQLRLKETQDEIARLRASDPVLNDALKSLDSMTSALMD
jgi:heme/copper-type cytochrome/quinol oxidase subunit 4